MIDTSIPKTRQDYNRIASYFSATRNRVWSELNQFKNFIKDGQNILDWGCGNGHLLEFFTDYNIKYFGVDISDKLIDLANELYQFNVQSGQAQFFKIGDKDKEFANDFFDLVFMVASFHHLPDEKSRLEVLQKVYQEMKNKGQLIITVWNLKSEWIKKKKEIERYGDNDYLVYWKNQNREVVSKLYYHHFTEEELTDLLFEVGFKINKIENGDRNLVVCAEKYL